MTLQEIAQQMCRMKECEEFPLKWKTEVEGWIFALNQWAEVAEVIPDAEWTVAKNPNLGKCLQTIYICSNCNIAVGCENFVRRSFCPNCGSKMKR